MKSHLRKSILGVGALDKAANRVRNAEFYDAVLRERSPFTGMLPPAPRVEIHTRFSSLPPRPATEWVTGSFTRSSVRAGHMAAAALAVLISVIGVFASMRDGDEAAARSDTEARADTAAPRENGSQKRYTTDVALPREVVKPPRSPEPMAQVAIPETQPETRDEEEAAPGRYEVMLEQALKTAPRAARIERLHEVIELYPEGDEALARLSILILENPRTRPEALDLAERATSVNPDNAMGWIAIGYIHQLGGARSKAREAYQRCASASGPKRYVQDCRNML